MLALRTATYCTENERTPRHGDGVRQALRVHPYVALDARDLFTGVIPLERGRVRVLDALRIHDQQCRLCAAPQF